MSLGQRTIAIFTRPAQAWAGLETRSQWWFPLVVMTLLNVGVTLLLHQRALLPMISEQWQREVDNGRMTTEQLDRMQAFMSSPAGIAITSVQQLIALPIVMLVVALVIWFGVGFVLGTNLKFRLALEVAAWSWFVTIPALVLTAVLAWMKETMRVHVGFGALLPE